MLSNVFGSDAVRCFREIPLDMASDLPSNIVCFAFNNVDDSSSSGGGVSDEGREHAENTSPGQPLFDVPTTGDYTAPPELSSFWVQAHFHEWEITQDLRDAAEQGLASEYLIRLLDCISSECLITLLYHLPSQ